MRKIKILLVIISLSIYSSTFAQDTLIVEDVDNYSFEYFYGVKYKLKIFNWFSNGIAVNYNIQSINFKEQLTTGYPANMKDKITLHNFGAEYFWRFSFGKNGNSIGTYVDLGVWGKYMVGNKYSLKFADSNPLYSSRAQKEVYKGIDLFNPYSYGASLRIGSKQFAFVANYTISDVFSQTTIQTKNIYDLPKLSVGIEIAVVD